MTSVTTLVLISIFSSLLFFITILFEGKLKKEKESSSFFNEIKKLNFIGWLVIFIVIAINLSESFLSINNISEEKERYSQDTLRLYNINESLRSQNIALKEGRISDSITISRLEKIAMRNLDKTDSINRNIILTAAKESKRQLDAIESKNQNIYNHFKSELKTNYFILVRQFNSTALDGFLDTTLFIYSNFKNNYINEYSYISSNSKLISDLIAISQAIERINHFSTLSVGIKGDDKKLNISNIKRNVKLIKEGLLFEYLVTEKYKDYKDYELNRNSTIFNINRDSIDNVIKNM